MIKGIAIFTLGTIAYLALGHGNAREAVVMIELVAILSLYGAARLVSALIHRLRAP